ncbi:zinc finger protein 1-like [Vicia villosa]|uniref:zinc finger protein 1-like n=1 Tax=Vicia villosa TaxID=3911 RepID=UPI00273C67C0|nr:zinc finger protein 1-like [Vicia villosa]
MAKEEPNVESKKNFHKQNFPFLLFGFIIDPTKRNQKAYSCNFCSKKFVTPQAKGGHQNCHKSERKLKKNNETIKKAWEIFSNDNVSRQVTMTENDFDLVLEGDADSNVDHEHKVTHKEEASKDIDLNLKL